ncbi:early growth response protein 1-B-like isoform X2 [Prorops nasuta]
MTMAESAVEDAAAAPPGPAKPPPPSYTNNNSLAATANRNHRNPRKRKRLSQVVDILQAHRSTPSEGEILPFESNGPASEEDEDVSRSPRLSSRSAADSPAAISSLPLRIKDEKSTPPPTEEQTNQKSRRQNSNHSYQSYHHHHHHHHHHRHRNHHRNNAGNQASLERHHSSHHQNHRSQSTEYNGCSCVQCTQQPSSPTMVLPSAATSPLTPQTPLAPLTPLSLPPLTPGSLSSYSFEYYMHTKYLPDIFRGRSHSDSDVVPGWDQRVPSSSVSSAVHPSRSGSLDSDTNSPQESPLDLSMKNLMSAAAAVAAATAARRPPALQLLPPGIVTRGSVSVPVVRGDVASRTTKESVAVRYNLEVSPVVEEMPPGADVAYVCPDCGQMFSLHDRLAKHMASRHRRQNAQEASAKAYLCDVCKRSFARSDMLTRHMRLHTGIKPYTCKTCNQVFSRSDHLSTHLRTHTGEKPYKCPQCPYAACRRDMITRHQRTHARFPELQTPKSEPEIPMDDSSPTFAQGMSPSVTIKAE